MLKAARELFPDVRTVLLTAYADTDVAIGAINDLRLDYYILKPWDPPEERLYPIVDDLLEDWHALHRDRPADVDPRRRDALVGRHPPRARLPPAQPDPDAVARRRGERGGPAADGRRR